MANKKMPQASQASTAMAKLVDEQSTRISGNFDAKKFKRKVITRPQLKLNAGVAYHIEITGVMFEGKVIKGREGKAPTMIPCIHLESGMECTIIANKSVQDDLITNYPKDSYVGKKFEIVKGDTVPIKGGRRFAPCFLSELVAK